VADPTEAQDHAVMETKSATIHRKMPMAARQLPITGSAHKTAVVGDADRAAVIALLDMATERWGAARLDSGHDAALVGRKPTALRGAKRIAVAAKDVRHLQIGAHEPALLGRDHLQRELIEGARRPGDQPGRDLG